MFLRKTAEIPSKKQIRSLMVKKCASLGREEFTRNGREAAARLWAHRIWKKYSTILVFLSMENEISTLTLIQLAQIDRKRLFAPRVEGDNLAFYSMAEPVSLPSGQLFPSLPLSCGKFGIPEPDPKNAAALKAEDFPALIITPGLAFDRQGRRLGRGGGYYDRFFAALDAGIVSGGSPTETGKSLPGPEDPANLTGGPGLTVTKTANLSFSACGLCMNIQLFPEIPVEAHDRCMDLVLTEKQLLLSAGVPSKTNA
jgi:5-formyltetrahydrofolate cyclo-ligase